MNQTTKVAVYTFGILLLLSSIYLVWQAYERSRETAEQQKFCELLKQASTPGEDTSQLSDADIYRYPSNKKMYEMQCP